jgi:uncharacterized protein (DUF885 family)
VGPPANQREHIVKLNAGIAFISAAVCAAICGCIGLAQSPRSVEAIADEYLAAYLERHPETGTYLSLPGARHDRLTDNSLQALAAWRAREDTWLAELDALGASDEVGSRDWVTYGILRESLARSVGRRVCRPELWPVSSVTAWHESVPSLFEIQPVDTPDERQQALDRLSRLAEYVDTEVANLREGLTLGYSAPQLNVPAVIRESRTLLADDSALLSPGARAGDPAYAAALREVFERRTAPAIERYARFLETTYLPRAREAIAVSTNPDGAACYPATVRYFATISPSADEIHATGLEHVARIRAEMQQVIDEHFEGETIESLMARLNTDPAFTFRTREEVLQYSIDSLDLAKQSMSRAFGRLPKAEVVIKPYPPYREGSGTGEYHASSVDGTRPGIYYIAVRNPEQRTIAGQQAVLYHETYPGHHLQGAVALELGDRVHPLARYLWNSGYGEGWALYAEKVADELDLYSNALERLGLLSSVGARAARLVVDTGLHTRDWPRQRAVDYMLANTAWPPDDIQSEVDRYIAWPGQATAYMLGMLEIRRLRELAEVELGADFDIRAFHDRVLENGNITLPMLEDSILAWIADQR